MIKSKSLSEKVFNQINNNLVGENKKNTIIEKIKKIKNSFQKIQPEKRTMSLKKGKNLENKLTIEPINDTTTSKDKTSNESPSPIKKRNTILNNSISSNKIKNIHFSNKINNSNNNHQIITPKKQITKEIKYILLKNKNELPQKKNLNYTKRPIKKNKTTHLNDNELRKSFEHKINNIIKTPLKKRKYSDNTDQKMSLTTTGNNDLISKYLEKKNDIIKELEEPINFKDDIDIVSSTTLSLYSPPSNFNSDFLNNSISHFNNDSSNKNFKHLRKDYSLTERNKKIKSISLNKSIKNNINSNIIRFSGITNHKLKSNFKLNLTLTTIKETNINDNHHYEKNTVSTLNKKVKIKKLKTINHQNKNRNEDNDEKGKTLIYYKRAKTSKTQNNTLSLTNTIENQNNNHFIKNNNSQTNNSNKIFNGKIESYILGKELGKGSYATVRLGIHKETKKKYAIKIYSKLSLFDIQKNNIVKNEISILKHLDHDNIMKMYEVIDTPKNLYLILEYINGISLLQYIKQKNEHKIDEKTCKNFFYQIVKGINYCQLKNICHRDIKLENILLVENKKIKIIDFGFGVKSNNNTYHKFFCGTPSYMPPEIINKEKYIAQYSDIWSLGILLYTMLCGNFPFIANNENELFEKINQGNYLIPNYISDKGKKLLKKILVFKPKNRPSTEEILLDEWFEDM